MNATVTRLEDYDTNQRFQATVVSSDRITPESSDIEVRELTLDVQNADFDFQLGQSVGVLAPGSKEFGQEVHFRLYSVADLPTQGEAGKPRITICVRRCSYIDEYSGERYDGIASNYLCDLRPGDTLLVTGPFELPFDVPDRPLVQARTEEIERNGGNAFMEYCFSNKTFITVLMAALSPSRSRFLPLIRVPRSSCSRKICIPSELT